MLLSKYESYMELLCESNWIKIPVIEFEEKLAEINERVDEVQAVIDTMEAGEEKTEYESRLESIKDNVDAAVENEDLDGVEDLLEELEDELGIENKNKDKTLITFFIAKTS